MISVVIPIFNAEKYLRECLDGLLAQTYTDFELVLVDDGSSDESLKICKSYKQKDKRIKIFHKNNGGASDSRNYGIDKVSGDYLCFVDSDDIVSKDYLIDLYNSIDHHTDFVMSNFYYIDGTYKYSPPKAKDNKGGIEILLTDYRRLKTCYAPYGKLFRTSIIRQNNIRFDKNVHVGEDRLFVFTYLLEANLVAFSSKVNYYYCRRPGSLSLKIYSFEEEYYAYTQAYNLVKLFLSKKNITDHRQKSMLLSMVCDFANRTINSIYHNSHRSYETRMRLLEMVDWVSLGKYMYVGNIKDLMIKLLYKLQSRKLYDYLRMLKFG